MSFRECEDGWEASVIDSVLEKLEGVGPVVHICVDADSQEGLVYLKCASLETAGLARLALHGWWFDGTVINSCKVFIYWKTTMFINTK